MMFTVAGTITPVYGKQGAIIALAFFKPGGAELNASTFTEMELCFFEKIADGIKEEIEVVRQSRKAT